MAAPSVIYPPPDIRVIVDKTATFVASRGGLDLEDKVREKERNNPKFSFLNPGDPYYPYYQMRLSDVRSGKGAV
jgi:splicing factor 3A subunit 1